MLISQQKVNWYRKTNQGWYKIIHVKFTEEDKKLIKENSPKVHGIIKKFNEASIQKIDEPPPIVKDAYDKYHNPEKELIAANISDKGKGTIYEKIKNVFTRVEI